MDIFKNMLGKVLEVISEAFVLFAIVNGMLFWGIIGSVKDFANDVKEDANSNDETSKASKYFRFAIYYLTIGLNVLLIVLLPIVILIANYLLLNFPSEGLINKLTTLSIDYNSWWSYFIIPCVNVIVLLLTTREYRKVSGGSSESLGMMLCIYSLLLLVTSIIVGVIRLGLDFL